MHCCDINVCEKKSEDFVYVYLSITNGRYSIPPQIDGSVLQMFFYYLMNLNIMTIKVKVSTAADLTGAISAGWVNECAGALNWGVFFSMTVWNLIPNICMLHSH